MFEWMQTHPDLYAWVILPGLIFVARVIDVSLGTARVVFISRGYKLLAASIGFWEVLIWLVAIGHATQNLSNPMCVIAFAMGFAMGNYIGVTLTEKMSLGVVLVRILTHENSDNLIDALKNQKYGLTSIDGHGAFGPMKVIFTIVQRQSVDEVIKIIQSHNPNAFYSIESIGEVSKGKLAPRKLPGGISVSQVFRPFRKGK
ncbi:MAG: DUF2179 domain-containing protein [Phycisphaerae bacterium]|nr:DUF2179 domain-containing protein [Phycisphaerae bacterium]